MKIIIHNDNTRSIPITEAKYGKVYIITDVSKEVMSQYKNNIIIRLANDLSNYISLLFIGNYTAGSFITQLTFDKRECDKSEYKLFKIREVAIETIEVKLLYD